MKDIPVFATPYGVASLVLKEIPYRGQAYIHLRSGEDPELLLSECVNFCTMAGAETVFAAGEGLEAYLVYCSVLEMRGTAWVDREKLKNLFPVTEASVSQWRSIYNEKMAGVDNAATLTAFDEQRIVSSGGAYFVHDCGKLLGIGWLEDTKLLAIASVEPGAGETVAHTLMSMVEYADMTLEVASTNTRAIALYEKLGFLTTREITRWHRVK